MENLVMRHVRKGLMAMSLSVVLCIGGAVIANAQSAPPQPDPSQPTINPQSQSPSTAPGSSSAAEPSTSSPSTAPDQDNGMRPAPNKDDQSQQPMSEQSPQDRDKNAMSAGATDKDITNGELKKFAKFLDSHKKIADDLQKDPQRVNDPGYVSSHKDLAKFLEDHPKVREELKENPAAFMNRENKYEKHEDKNPQSPQQ